MKVFIVFFSILFPILLLAQKNEVQINEKQEDRTIILSAKNKSKIAQQVELKLTTKGFDVEKEKIITEVIPAKSEKEMIRLSALPGKRASYSYNYKYSLYQVRETIEVTDQAPASTITSNDESPAPPPPKDTKEKTDHEKITVFSKNGCGRCAATVSFLKNNNIDFEELNTSRSKKNHELLSQKLFASGFKGGAFLTPAILVNEELHYNIQDLQGFLEGLANRK